MPEDTPSPKPPPEKAPPAKLPEVAPGAPPPEATPPAGFSRALVYAGATFLLLLSLALAGGWLMEAIETRRLVASFEAERAAQAEAHRQALSAQAGEMLRLTVLPLSWAVRAELQKGDLAPVDEYFRAFVQERGVQRVMLIDKDDRIALASNRKHESQPAEALVSAALRDAKEPRLEQGDGFVRLAVPIMGLDSRLGILIVDYAPTGG